MKRTALFLMVLTGCSDYDLYRPDEVVNPGDPETEPSEPEEDPDIAVSPASLDFGSVLKDCTSDPLTVTVVNEGLGTLEVSTIELEGNGTSAFIHTGNTLSLEYQEEATFDVSFLPTAWLDYDINVIVNSNDPDEATTRVTAIGTGAAGALYEEGFTQDYNELVDVLWVIDNSGSMSDEVASIASNFQTFIDEFTTLDLDYHIAVVTTDMNDPNDSGKFQGVVITPETVNPAYEFTAQADQGSTGSATEQGFAAVQAALSEPLLSGANAGFLRDKATISVIVVTDEDDSSSINATNFVSWFQALKPDPEMVQFNGFFNVGFEDFFSWDGYIDAVEATNGFYDSIQSTSFELALQNLAVAAAGMVITFYLTEEPATLADMTVVVEGQDVPQSTENGWTYDSETNAITFHGESIPGPGEDVDISYTKTSECQ
ncbi:MAG: hypothetical protein ACI8RZ_005593 [Myxococcota bacterium]|jgi:hypothetical protein